MNKTTVQKLIDEGIICEPMDGNHGELHPKVNDYVPSGIPFLMANDINGIADVDNCSFISEEQAKTLRKGFSKEGDVLITHKASIGRTAIMPYLKTDYAVLTPQVTYYRILKPDVLNNRYLKYYFDSPGFQYIIKKRAGAGSTRAYIGILQQHDLPIEYPTIQEQEKIVSILSPIDEKIRNNTAICSDLESMAKLLYDYWFVQFDFPDENGKPYKSSGGKMVWNEELKREIPEGWEVKHASDLTTVKTGKEDANFASVDGGFAYFTCGQDVLKCDIPAFEGKAVLLAGNGDFNVKHYSGRFNAYQRTYVLIPYDSKYYALLYIATKEAIARFTHGSAGSIVKFITLGDVNGITLLDPKNDKMLEKFNLILETIEHVQEENQQLASLRDFLLPMLMNGQVKVK